MRTQEREIMQQIQPLLDAAPLRLAILFGSTARGTARMDSDVDLGIIPRDPAWPMSAELTLAAELETACGRTVDLARLDHAEEVLRWAVARDGVVLISDPPQVAVRFIARAAIDHADLAPTVEAAMRRYATRTSRMAQ